MQSQFMLSYNNHKDKLLFSYLQRKLASVCLLNKILIRDYLTFHELNTLSKYSFSNLPAFFRRYERRKPISSWITDDVLV